VFASAHVFDCVCRYYTLFSECARVRACVHAYVYASVCVCVHVRARMFVAVSLYTASNTLR
jgi:hypothetical protein